MSVNMEEWNKIVRIGRVELPFHEAYRMYRYRMFLATSTTIFQLYYNAEKRRVFGYPIFVHKGLCRRGRFHVLDATDVNVLVGFELINPNFPVITEATQRLYEDIIKAKADGIPMICGCYGRACRQINATEGANRSSCMSCPLARFASINIDTKDS